MGLPRGFIGSVVVFMACGRAPLDSAVEVPAPSTAERLAAEVADYRGTTVAVRSTARLVRDPSTADQWLSLAESIDPSEGPTHYTFMLVGTHQGWLEVDSDAAYVGDCGYALPLRDLRLRLFVSREDVVLEPERHPDACHDDSDTGYVEPSDEPALEIWGPRLAVTAETRVVGRRLVPVRGCPSCVVQSHMRAVPVIERVEDPPLYWPSGELAGHATADLAMRDPQSAGDRICFSAQDGRLHPAGAALRLCVDRGFVHVRDTRQRGPNARPELLTHRPAEPLPPDAPFPVARSYAAVDNELRSRHEALFACITPHDRRFRFSVGVQADGTALPRRDGHGEELRACLHDALNAPPWPKAGARTGIDFVPERLADLPRAEEP